MVALAEDDPHFATVDDDPGDRTPRCPGHHAPVSTSPTATRCRPGWATTSATAAGRSAASSTPRVRCDDQLLVNMSEDDFATVMAPKITGTRVLHDAFRGHDLEFFVMFGSAGSTIASPGQGNYAAANAFLDAFAHYRQAQGLPALTIGWGPWSVGMVEELKLEKIYAQRGIELITPAVGARILDRLINQKTPQRRRHHRRLEPSPPGRVRRPAAADVLRTRGFRSFLRRTAIRTRRCSTLLVGHAGIRAARRRHRSRAAHRRRRLRLRRRRHRTRRHAGRHRPGLHDGDGLPGPDQHDVLDRPPGARDPAGRQRQLAGRPSARRAPLDSTATAPRSPTSRPSPPTTTTTSTG